MMVLIVYVVLNMFLGAAGALNVLGSGRRAHREEGETMTEPINDYIEESIDWDYFYDDKKPKPTWWQRIVEYHKRATREVLEAPEGEYWP